LDGYRRQLLDDDLEPSMDRVELVLADLEVITFEVETDP
jgi:hypothetical protein